MCKKCVFLFGAIVESEVNLDLINNAICVVSRGGDWEKPLQPQCKVESDRIAFNAIISVCGKGDERREALRFFIFLICNGRAKS